MHENEISGAIVDAAFKVHTTLGPGLLESIYEVAMTHILRKRGFKVLRQVVVPIVIEGETLDEAFRADLIVEDKIVVELKSVEGIAPVHRKQTLSYTRLLGLRIGLLINFNVALIKDGITRVVNGMPDSPLPSPAGQRGSPGSRIVLDPVRIRVS
ncbi:MAG: GxxExxY protein [Planctomycetes bacterium]|nr:GxxExxY protein [Planctomycetota bacterium]